MKFYIEQCIGGYWVVCEPGDGWPRYLTKRYRGRRTWMFDYTYAKTYSKRTAQTIVRELEAENR